MDRAAQLVNQITTNNPTNPNNHHRQINCCVIGYGMSGKGFHCYMISINQKLNLHSIYIRDINQSQSVHIDYPNVIIYTSWNDVLNDTDIDLCVIATPPSAHYQQSIDLLHSNKHIVIDKPIVTNYNELQLIDNMNKLINHMWC